MSEDYSEIQLIELTLNGDVDAFGELVRLYERPVYNLAYRMLGNATEAEDAAQEAFIKAYSHLNKYDIHRSFKTWLLSITSNHCIDRLRKRRLSLLSIDEPLPPHPALVSKEDDPEASAMAQERSEFVQNLLKELSEDYRLVIVLRYWYDCSYAEIAEITDSTESAIKSRLFRARQTLAQLVDTTGDPLINLALENET